MKILITGIAGTIGTILASDLEGDHEVHGLDTRPVARPNTAAVDLRDASAMASAFRAKDVVIHLAADRRHEVEIGWDDLMGPNVVATANVFDAARTSGVRRVIFASSMHVMGGYESDEAYRSIVSGRYGGLAPDDVPLVGGDMPVRPDSRYAASKAFGEALGRYYADAESMEVVSVRIGAITENDRPGVDQRSWVAWFSQRDVAGFFRACVERPGLRHEVLYAASANRWKIYDTPYAWRVLGFQPTDNAEDFRSSG